MSRHEGLLYSSTPRFPRVSGDEPKTPHALSVYDMFSPRERG